MVFIILNIDKYANFSFYNSIECHKFQSDFKHEFAENPTSLLDINNDKEISIINRSSDIPSDKYDVNISNKNKNTPYCPVNIKKSIDFNEPNKFINIKIYKPKYRFLQNPVDLSFLNNETKNNILNNNQ